ncbi:hypothetical protein BD410DRAFT_757730 [Rickenella mellea]|uniref:Uncharacterized protein n=1 Tax=Rickenella mellea TaxID=50990 RepID=A0A4R5XDE4_9AGAM|nr:hypothetical protein BD410DRAFT_757730 [Rickenella mellea]
MRAGIANKPWTAQDIYDVSLVLTKDRFTRNFRHMLEIDKKILRRIPKGAEQAPKIVPSSSRIKWWNIVTGDQVRDIQKKDGSVREVIACSKLTNEVFVKSDVQPGSDFYSREGVLKNSFPVLYHRLQLYIGTYEFPPKNPGEQPRSLPVFAKRLGHTPRQWTGGKWFWERFATSTIPRLPGWFPGKKEHIPIPWPTKNAAKVHPPGIYDTRAKIATRITYEPAPVPSEPPELLVSSKSMEDDYFDMLRGRKAYDQSQPMEVAVSRELSNPHSRAKKRERWRQKMALQKKRLEDFMAKELKTPLDRTRRQIRAEAHFKWQRILQEERKLEMIRRWELSGRKAKLEDKTARKRKKVEKEKERLRNLVLTHEPHQVVPELQV